MIELECNAKQCWLFKIALAIVHCGIAGALFFIWLYAHGWLYWKISMKIVSTNEIIYHKLNLRDCIDIGIDTNSLESWWDRLNNNANNEGNFNSDVAN